MARMAAQDPALTGLALELAAQTLVSRAKATKVVSISNLVKGISSSSVVIRVIQSSSTGVNIMFSQLVSASMIIRFINVQSILLSQRYPSICGGQSIQ